MPIRSGNPDFIAKNIERMAKAIADANPKVNYAQLFERLAALKRDGIISPGFNLLPPFARPTGKPPRNKRRPVMKSIEID